MIKELISKVVKKQDLSVEEMEKAMDEIMSGEATPAQIGAFITALRMKGETVDEITGAARTMRARVTRIFVDNHQVSIDRDDINIDEEIIDIVGTGGDGTKTFNVSTTTAFVTAGAGVRVAKHGNRAVSSLCGSADVLEGLGVKLDISAADAERCVNRVGIGFLFAPLFHGAMKHAAGPRKEIGIRSIFNLLGPITNPAGARSMVLGVYDLDLTETIANVMKNLQAKDVFVVCGEGTFDEISICGPTKISRLKDGEVNTFRITPEEYGFRTASIEDIVGGNSEQNARIIRKILDGEKGAKRDMVLLNAAAAFVVAGLCDSIKQGIPIAEESIDSGNARKKLDQLVEFTNRCVSI